MELQEKLEHTLRNLGDTPDEIAAFLEGQGIKGQRHHASGCVLAVYLHKVFDMSVSVGYSAMLHTTIKKLDINFGYKPEAICPLPSSTRLFVLKFDDGKYPNLVKGTA